MAESDTILQLGIEAAREGNREEARNLFGLLTRQEPDNAQAWLWLAGVADGPEQRRAALERAVELDPTNEMAVKGLQAMGVHPTVKLDEDDVPSIPAAATVAAAPARAMTDEERYAAELDSAFDDYDTVPRSETPRREVGETAEMLAGEAAADRATASGRSARERSAARRASTPIRSDDDDEMRVVPARRPNNLLWLLVGLIALLLVGYLAYRFLFNRSGPIETADNPTAIAATAAAGSGAGQAGTAVPTTEGSAGGTNVLTDTTGITPTTALTDTAGITPTTTLTDTASAPPPPQQPAAQGSIPAPVANPNAQPAGIGSLLDANGWTYTYPDASFVLVRGNQIGSFTAKGTYLHVLAWVANNTGTQQPLPAGIFALKDAQGNVYVGEPQVSSAGVQRGVNADVSMEDPIPANGVLTSVYLVFDVPPGAQGLFLFAAGKNDQGWPLNMVP